MFIISATGHRPEKLGGHNTITEKRLRLVATASLEKLMKESLIQRQEPVCVISGMALGWDTAVAQAALELEIPLICAIPCPEQPSRWPPKSVAVWADIRARAAAVHVISPSYSATAMQLRNEWMVDRARLMLALYNGSKGGTRNCLDYARQKQVSILNVWKQFKLETL